MLKGFEQEMNLIEHPDNNSLLFKGKPKKSYYSIESILPGTYSVFEHKFRVLASWRFIRQHIPYHICRLGFDTNNIIDTNKFIQEAVIKRIGNKQVNVILTGRYEAFMIASIANEKLGEQEKYINTFSWSEGRRPSTTNSEGNEATEGVWSEEQSSSTTNSKGRFTPGAVWSDSTDEKDIKLVTEHLKTNHTVVTVTDADIENEKENIDPEFTDDGKLWSEPLCGSTTNFGKVWLMAKTIARISPNSVVFLEIGMDNLDRLLESDPIVALSQIDFQHRLYNYYKTVCSDRLNKISKIFWHHGLEVQIPCLDNELVQHFITNCKNVEFTFNPIGVYGNKLLPEVLF
jgi:hypothetical protein